jgi:hypothetical protein
MITAQQEQIQALMADSKGEYQLELENPAAHGVGRLIDH